MIKIFLTVILVFFITGCSEKTIYSGKIINQENLNNINFKNKETLILKFGHPSYIDTIENKYFYFTQKSTQNNPVNKKIEYSYIFVFTLNEMDEIIYSKAYDISNRDEINLVSEQTSNSIIKRGLLERIFGGVGTQQELPNTP
tara:strand:- start:130 stop:558 length:429 start_codon:yes stop_codon:yes gene_type:complete